MSTRTKPTDEQSRPRPVSGQPRWRTSSVVVTALVLALAVIGTVWLLRGDAEPGTVFSWGDDLNEWVTEAEMTAILEDVSARYAGTGPDGVAVFDRESADSGTWTAGGWSVGFHNGDHGGRYVGPRIETDQRLPLGVTYEQEMGFGWGHYILSGPNSDEMIAIWLRPPGKQGFGYPHESEVDAYEDMVFALATQMLQEMGWAD